MRTNTAAKSKILSIRLDVVPLLTQRATNYIVHALEDDSLGIKNDRRDFLAKPPKQGTEISKVMSKSFSFKILNMWLYKR